MVGNSDRQMGLPLQVLLPVLAVVQWNIVQLVTVDPLQEVSHGLLFVTVHIIRTAQLYLLSSERQSVKD